MYRSTKTFGHEFGLSCCFRQWRAESHCRHLHGYALAVTLVFETSTLDQNNWVVDFGSFSEVKDWLKQNFDHKLLVAGDDPLKESILKACSEGAAEVVVVKATGCEAFAKMIYDFVRDWLVRKGKNQVVVKSVEVREHGSNSALYCADKIWP